jgi:hypothetical protein
MYQILPIHWIVIAVAWLTLTLLAVIGISVNLLNLPEYLHYAILVADLLLILITWKPIWIWFWNAFPGLNTWFPDLNGQYDVELHHNWPIQQRLLQAASGGEKFDPRYDERPELAVARLRAPSMLAFTGCM